MIRPTPEGHCPCAPFPRSAFATAHPGIINIQPLGHAIVVHEDHNGIFIQPLGFEKVQYPPHVGVQVLNHRQIRGMRIIQTRLAERRDKRLRCGQRRVWRIRRQITKERLIPTLFDKCHRLVKKQIFTVAFALTAHTIANHLRIEVLARPHRVRRTPVKTTMLRTIADTIAQMPLANKTGLITRGFQQLRQSHRVLKQMLTRLQRMRHRIAKLMLPGQ